MSWCHKTVTRTAPWRFEMIIAAAALVSHRIQSSFTKSYSVCIIRRGKNIHHLKKSFLHLICKCNRNILTIISCATFSNLRFLNLQLLSFSEWQLKHNQNTYSRWRRALWVRCGTSLSFSALKWELGWRRHGRSEAACCSTGRTFPLRYSWALETGLCVIYLHPTRPSPSWSLWHIWTPARLS